MPIGLVRYQNTRKFHFLTFSCYQRKPFLASSEAKNITLEILEETRSQRGLTIAAYVLMPEHVHLLTNEPSTGTLATWLQVFKQRTSRALRSPDQKQFWQTHYYDFKVASTGKYSEKIQYIHRNPVTRGLVTKSEDYPWSSFNHYATGSTGPIKIEPH